MAKWAREHANEVIGLMGLLLLSVGCGAVMWPLALIVPGAVLVVDALRGNKT